MATTTNTQKHPATPNRYPNTPALKKFLNPALCALAALALCSTVQAAKFYKWVDRNGVTHYSAKPPAPGVGTVIKVSGSAVSAPTPAGAEEKPAAKNKKAAKDFDPQAEADRLNKEQVAKQCSSFRKNLATMNKHSRIRLVKQDGSIEVLGEDQRQERIKEAQDFIKESCNNQKG